MKKIVCGEFGDIYYATIDAKGRMRGNRAEVTDDAIIAVMEHMASEAGSKRQFDGKYTIEINSFKLTLDCSGNESFMARHSGKE